jgi:hypothetical protein
MIEVAKLTTGRRRRGLRRFSAEHSSCPRSLPAAIFANGHTLSPIAQLNETGAISFFNDAVAGGRAETVDSAPLEKRQNRIFIVRRERTRARMLLALPLRFTSGFIFCSFALGVV